MSKLNYKKIFAALLPALFLVPLFIFADSSGAVIQNPLGSRNNSVQAVLVSIMNIVATVGGIVVVFFIIYSGFKFVTAGDSDSDRTKARNIFYGTVIGGAILLGADIIANVVVNTVSAIR